MNQPHKEEIARVVAEVDKDNPSIEARYQLVMDHLKKHESITNWDVLCFCACYLAAIVTTNPSFSWLTNTAKWLYRDVIAAYYYRLEFKESNEKL